MGLQAERITEVCDALGLSGMANQYDALVQAAAKAESSNTALTSAMLDRILHHSHVI